MREGHRSNPPLQQTQEHVDVKPFETAAELRRPKNLKELREATEDVFLDVEVGLLFHAMGEQFETVAWEEWVQVADVLESLFLEEKDGVLGKRLLELHAMDDAQFQSHHGSAQDLIALTQTYASEMAPLVERLVLFGYADSLEAAVERLSHGALVADKNVFGTPVKQERVSLIGLLRDVEARMGGGVWSLEHAPEVPNQVVLRDPFDSSDPEVAQYWRDRILARRGMDRSVEPTVFSESADVTQKLVYEFGVLSEREGEEGLQEAGRILADWISSKSVYYDRPIPKQFEGYHLGLESPEMLMKVMKALDEIKHAAPAFFVELTGVRAEGGGISEYFGSFLHKALVNTRRVVESRRESFGDVAFVTMVDDLLTMDGRVQTYAGVMTQEGLKQMASHMTDRIGKASTGQDKAGELISVIAPYVPLAVDAGVRMQLEAFREHNVETVREDMRRFVDDPTQTLTVLEYIAQMSPDMLGDAQVQAMLGELFAHATVGEEKISYWLETGKITRLAEQREFILLKGLYRRIPLNDPSKPDFGEGERMRVMVRDLEARLGLRSKVSLASVGRVEFSNGSDRVLMQEYHHEWSGRYPASAVEGLGSDLFMRRYIRGIQESVSAPVTWIMDDDDFLGSHRIRRSMGYVSKEDHAWIVALGDRGFREMYVHDSVEVFDEAEYEKVGTDLQEAMDAYDRSTGELIQLPSGQSRSITELSVSEQWELGERAAQIAKIKARRHALSAQVAALTTRRSELGFAKELRDGELPPVKDVLYCMLGQKDGYARVWKHLDIFAKHLDPAELMAVLDGWHEGTQVRPDAMRELLKTCIAQSNAPDHVKEYMRVVAERLLDQGQGKKEWHGGSDESTSDTHERCVQAVEELLSLRSVAESEHTPLAHTITFHSFYEEDKDVVVDPVVYWNQLKRWNVPVIPLDECVSMPWSDEWWSMFELNIQQGLTEILLHEGQRTHETFAVSATMLFDALVTSNALKVPVTDSLRDTSWESRGASANRSDVEDKIKALLSAQFKQIR